MSLFGFCDGVKHWVGYFHVDQQSVIARLDNLADRLELVCDQADGASGPVV